MIKLYLVGTNSFDRILHLGILGIGVYEMVNGIFYHGKVNASLYGFATVLFVMALFLNEVLTGQLRVMAKDFAEKHR